MKNFIATVRNIWNIKELRDRILLALGLLLVYRFGAHVPLPGIDSGQLAALKDQTSSGVLGLLNAFTGGAFSKASVLALGIMPYISASIVVQLMGIAIPYLQKLQKEGESGRKKVNQITRWLTIAICLVQGPGYVANLTGQLPREAFLLGNGAVFWFTSTFLLTTGTVFAMWLGEKITDKGIGNGISLLIMVGIIARMPQAFIEEFAAKTQASNGGLIMILLEFVIWMLVILASVLLVMAVRRIPVQYARRAAGGTMQQKMAAARQYIPLKVNAAGVMPIIFAQAIMFIPVSVIGFSKSAWAQTIATIFSNMTGVWYNLLFAVLIIVFTYFYTAITIPTNKMADDLKRSGGFIPGIRPGKETAEYLDTIMSRITLPGSVFLALLAILPAIVMKFGVQHSWALFYGGTSLLIMVGVAIDTIQQVNSYLLSRHYDGLMKTGNKRKAVA